jgi:phosphopantothenoylcysteine decarboxylase/phosphopantothenate--cysteine ligase
LPDAPRVLITAGPTHEPIDSVRYLANRSSGRMGLALAEAAVARGWPATLLLGPTTRQPPEPTDHSRLRTIRFQTTTDLQRLLVEHWPSHDVLFMAAAVADFTPRAAGKEGKIKRAKGRLTLELDPTPDLLAQAAATSRANQVLIGFALEVADRLLASARHKVAAKGIHAIVANPLETMDSDHVSATILFREGRTVQAPNHVTKRTFADWLLDLLTPALRGQSTSVTTRV